MCYKDIIGNNPMLSIWCNLLLVLLKQILEVIAIYREVPFNGVFCWLKFMLNVFRTQESLFNIEITQLHHYSNKLVPNL